MKNVLIIQNDVLPYRKAVYNRLCQLYNITVLHSGSISRGHNDFFEERIVKLRRFGKFYWQDNFFDVIKKGNYDAIILMFDLWWIKNNLILIRNIGAKIILWGHRYSSNSFVNNIRNILMRRCDSILLYNGSEINKIVAANIPRDKIFIAENTIEVNNHEDGSSFPKSSFLYVGRAQKRKRIDILLKAFAQVQSELANNITIDIVGKGQENIDLKILAMELGIEAKVIFHGEVNDPAILKSLFFKAFAYVSPDAIGLGAQHSFAYGVPVVTFNSGFKGAEYDNLENDVNAILYNDHRELPAVLLSLVTNREKVKKLGETAYEIYTNRLTFEKMIEGFVGAIENRSKNVQNFY